MSEVQAMATAIVRQVAVMRQRPDPHAPECGTLRPGVRVPYLVQDKVPANFEAIGFNGGVVYVPAGTVEEERP